MIFAEGDSGKELLIQGGAVGALITVTTVFLTALKWLFEKSSTNQAAVIAAHEKAFSQLSASHEKGMTEMAREFKAGLTEIARVIERHDTENRELLDKHIEVTVSTNKAVTGMASELTQNTREIANMKQDMQNLRATLEQTRKAGPPK